MEITLLDTTLLPIIIGMVAMVKKSGVQSHWLPIVAVALGVLGTWIYQQNPEWLAGVVVGLSAVGLYDGTRATFAK